MTNGDRIRNMTDEELAEFLVSDACQHCEFHNDFGCHLGNPCVKELAAVMIHGFLTSEAVHQEGGNAHDKRRQDT